LIFIGRTDNAVDTIVMLMREISQLAVADDWIIFDPASFAGESIRKMPDYAGVRTSEEWITPESTC
jgi:hypothetical protein